MKLFSRFSRPQSAPLPSLDRRQSLKSIPMLNQEVKTESRPDGNLTVIVHLKRRRGWLGRLQPPTFSRTYKLDELGSFVLRQIDGRRTAGAIIDDFVRKYKVNGREAELCVTQFMRMLVHRQVICIIVP